MDQMYCLAQIVSNFKSNMFYVNSVQFEYQSLNLLSIKQAEMLSVIVPQNIDFSILMRILILIGLIIFAY